MANTSNRHILWNTGDTSAVIEVNGAGKYSVTVQEEECRAIDTISLRGCPFKLYFPNAITPQNQDGINDQFYLSSTENIAVLEIHIYDRWGNVVFFSRDPHFRWDGSVKGRIISPEVYTYMIRLKTIQGPSFYYTGSLTVL